MGLSDKNAGEEVLTEVGKVAEGAAPITYARSLAIAQAKLGVNNLLRKGDTKSSGSVNSMNAPNANTTQRKCYICESTSHLKRDCPVIRAVRAVLNEQGQSGHVGKYFAPRGGAGGYRGHNVPNRGVSRGGFQRGFQRGFFQRGSGRGGQGRGSSWGNRGAINELSGASPNEDGEGYAHEDQGPESDSHDFGFTSYDPRVTAVAEAAAAALVAAEQESDQQSHSSSPALN